MDDIKRDMLQIISLGLKSKGVEVRLGVYGLQKMFRGWYLLLGKHAQTGRALTIPHEEKVRNLFVVVRSTTPKLKS